MASAALLRSAAGTCSRIRVASKYSSGVRIRSQLAFFSDQTQYKAQQARTAGGGWSVDRNTGIVSSSSSSSGDGSTTTYQTIIGLEIHARLTSSPTKLLSSSPNASSDNTSQPNTRISPQDLAHPGTLPRLSTSCIRHAILSTAALGCEVKRISRFERKHYFWHDLPHGYQVTQQRWPLGGEGILKVKRGVGTPDGRKTRKKNKGKGKKGKNKGTSGGASEENSDYFDVGIDRIQLEIDTAKTTTSSSNGNTSLINLNRAGAPLIEIVFQPTIRSASEAADAVETVRKVLKFAGSCDGRMENGNLRVDLNVSVAKKRDSTSSGDDTGDSIGTINTDAVSAMYARHLPPDVGNRTEVKNLNSLRQVVASAEYEAVRQATATESGTPPGKETRTFDTKSQRTVRIRDKGGAVDYRFMPEPDLPPVVLNEGVLGGRTLDRYLVECLPELPDDAVERLKSQYGLDEKVANVLTADPDVVKMYEDAVRVAVEEVGLSGDGGDRGGEDAEYMRLASSVANWLCNDLFALWKAEAVEGADGDDSGSGSSSSIIGSSVNAKRLGSLVAALHDGTVSTPMGKKILSVMYYEEPDLGPREIAASKGWKVITDMDELRRLCQDVVHDESNTKQLEQYMAGGKNIRKMSKFFLGKIMAVSRGNAHPGLAAEALDKVLDEAAPGTRAEDP